MTEETIPPSGVFCKPRATCPNAERCLRGKPAPVLEPGAKVVMEDCCEVELADLKSDRNSIYTVEIDHRRAKEVDRKMFHQAVRRRDGDALQFGGHHEFRIYRKRQNPVLHALAWERLWGF